MPSPGRRSIHIGNSGQVRAHVDSRPGNGRAKWASVGLREFGLDPPGYTATICRRDTLVLGAEFRAPNPQKVLQHMKLQGRAQVYLMARFVGEEWEKALREAAQR
jgi:hypothetical protein